MQFATDNDLKEALTNLERNMLKAVSEGDTHTVNLCRKTLELIPIEDQQRIMNPLHPNLVKEYTRRIKAYVARDTEAREVYDENKTNRLLGLIQQSQMSRADAAAILLPLITHLVASETPVEILARFKPYMRAPETE
jgi:hypothetical protein